MWTVYCVVPMRDRLTKIEILSHYGKLISRNLHLFIYLKQLKILIELDFYYTIIFWPSHTHTHTHTLETLVNGLSVQALIHCQSSFIYLFIYFE